MLTSLRPDILNLSIEDIQSKLSNESQTICNTLDSNIRSNLTEALPNSDNKPQFHEIIRPAARLYEEPYGATFL